MTVFTELTSKVYAAFGHDWTDSPSLSDFTEITDYVMSVTTNWGRRSWFDDHRAATATIVLRDPDRRFEPEYSSGAYHPDVLPWVPIWIELDHGSANNPAVFAGYAELWKTRYLPGDARGTVILRATDALGVLARYMVDLTVTGDTGDQMVGDILDDIGWPTNHRLLVAGTSTLQSYTADTTALAACQLVTRSEAGKLYAEPRSAEYGMGPERVGSYVIWSPRYNASGGSAAATYTFSDDPTGDSAHPYRPETVFEYDANSIYNRAEVTRISGTTQVHSDATSISAYGERTKSLSGLLLATDAECDDYAHFVVSRHKDPTRRITLIAQMAVRGQAWATKVPSPIQLTNMGVLVKRRPQGGTVFTEHLVIDGGRFRHRRGGPVRLTYYARPFKKEQWWTLDSDYSSQLEETTRLGW